MINFNIIKRYISKEFVKILFNVSLGCFCLGVVMNLLEEINFFKDYNVGVMIPFLASILKVPHLIFIMTPFIVLIATVWLFIKLTRSGELVVIKVSGFSNLTLIAIPGIIAFVLGIFFVLGFNPLTAALTKSYFNLKAEYSKSNDYLASVTVNGMVPSSSDVNPSNNSSWFSPSRPGSG